MKLYEALRAAEAQLTAAGVGNSAADAGWLLGHVLDLSRSGLLLQRERELLPAEVARYAELVQRRSAHEPLQYLLGTQPFYGLELAVTPAVLIPRPETEELVAEVLRRLRRHLWCGQPGRGRPPTQEAGTPLYLADICTGSGAIALALASELPAAHIWATDLSTAALAVAAGNAHRVGLANRVYFAHGDLLAPLDAALAPDGQPVKGRLAALVCNPPYVPDEDLPTLMAEVRDHEPHMALVTGTGDALHFYRRLAVEAQPYLRPGGLLAVELGVGQAEAVAELMQAAGWQQVTALPDSQGILRMVLCYNFRRIEGVDLSHPE